MGADLLSSFCEMTATEEEAIQNVETLFASKPVSELVKDLENDCGVSKWYGDSEELLNPQEVLEFFKDCVKTVYSSMGRRDCSFIVIDSNRYFYFTAGMSWGDNPTDCWESFVVCETYGLTLKAKPQ